MSETDPTTGPEGDPEASSSNTAVWVTVAVVVLAAIGLFLWLSGDDDDVEVEDEATATETESPSETESETASEEPTEDEETAEETETESDDGGAAPGDGPPVTIASFNFTESTILAEIYGQALEDAGFEVERQLDLGSREVIFPELTDGNIDLLPEYVGSALTVGFGGEATGDLDETLEALTAEFEAVGVVVLEPAPGEDKNVYVVTGDYSQDNGVTSIPDLSGVGDITLGGPPECEERQNCFVGLSGDPYNLSNLSFEAIPEGSVRIAALRNGEIEVTTLFSTQPVIEQEGFVVLEDPEGLVAVENIVPVVSQEVADAYGETMTSVVNAVSELITTETLIDLNGRVEIDAQDPADVAADFLSENDLVG